MALMRILTLGPFCELVFGVFYLQMTLITLSNQRLQLNAFCRTFFKTKHYCVKMNISKLCYLFCFVWFSTLICVLIVLYYLYSLYILFMHSLTSVHTKGPIYMPIYDSFEADPSDCGLFTDVGVH